MATPTNLATAGQLILAAADQLLAGARDPRDNDLIADLLALRLRIETLQPDTATLEPDTSGAGPLELLRAAHHTLASEEDAPTARIRTDLQDLLHRLDNGASHEH